MLEVTTLGMSNTHSSFTVSPWTIVHTTLQTILVEMLEGQRMMTPEAIVFA